MRPNTLGKKERIKSRKLIGLLFTSGKALTRYPLRLLYSSALAATEGAPPVQAGFAVSKKHFKKATDRNRIKRIMREAFRLNRTSLGAPAHPLLLFFIFTGKSKSSFKEMEAAMVAVLKQLAVKLEK